MTVDALGPRPELRMPFGDGPIALGAAYVVAGDLRGSAFRESVGAVLLCWPPGAGPRPGGKPAATYMSRAECDPRGGSSTHPHELAAAFLSAEDVDAAAATWSDWDLRGSRARRLAAVAAVAADRARSRARLLRDLRRGQQPPGSAAVACLGRRPEPLIRFPDGRGWWGDPRNIIEPWFWESESAPAMRLLAVGLDDEQCRRLAPLERVEAVEEELRRMGLA